MGKRKTSKKVAEDEEPKEKKLKTEQKSEGKKRGRKPKEVKSKEPVESTVQDAIATSNADHKPITLEKGHIYFFYRPKVELEEANSMDEVQKLFLVLRPEDNTEHDVSKQKYRLIVISKKVLPDIATRKRHWAFVDLVSTGMDEIKKKIGPTTYSTKTLGERHLAGCSPIGSGAYSIVHHPAEHKSSQHTHLVYVLELPEVPGELQDAFHIKKEASYIVTVKNPEAPNPEHLGLEDDQKAHFPSEVENEFEGKKYAPLDDIQMLNYQGAELILIGAAKEHEVTHELGKPAKELEETANKEKSHLDYVLDPKLFEDLLAYKKPEQIIPTEW